MKGNIPTVEEILQALPAEDDIVELHEPESAEATSPVQPVFDDARLQRIENLLIRNQKNQSLALELGGRIDPIKRDEMNFILATIRKQQIHLQSLDRLAKEIHRYLTKKIQPEDAVAPFVDKFSRRIDRLMQRVTALEVQAELTPEDGHLKPVHEFVAEDDFLS